MTEKKNPENQTAPATSVNQKFREVANRRFGNVATAIQSMHVFASQYGEKDDKYKFGADDAEKMHAAIVAEADKLRDKMLAAVNGKADEASEVTSLF